ncbi:hypothetical protein MBLNU230_g3560t1 [Neophaeotheca triangularis]
MLPTPPTPSLPPNVYEPSEDSYLLLDTLSSATEKRYLQAHFPANTPTPLIVEIGTGSGIVLAFLNTHAGEIFGQDRHVLTLGVEVSGVACETGKRTVLGAASSLEEEEEGEAGRGRGRNRSFLGIANADLTTVVKSHSVDVLVFNPPYVPTEELPALHQERRQQQHLSDSQAAFEHDSWLLSLTYAGGADGMEVTNRLLADVPRVLSERGVAYVLLCAQNKPREVARAVGEWEGGWVAEIVGSSGKKAGWEKLCVLRIARTT